MMRDEIDRTTQPLAVRAESRVHVEAIPSAGARGVGFRQYGIGVSQENHAGEITTHEWLERRANPRKIAGQLLIQNPL